MKTPLRRLRGDPKPASARKKINLGLQGGGAHGAFTWGVLDYLLEDGRLDIEGISGASAGAMNAVILTDGLARGGPEEARKRLGEFWRAVSLDGKLPGLQRAVLDRLLSFTPFQGSPADAWFGALSRYLSPYDINPLNINPLRDVIERFVDFEAVRGCKDVSLFISATNVHTGRLRVFPQEKVSADVVMASACLPFLFRAVEIDGVPYWDGGYMGNPAIFPFFGATLTEDVLVVQINPVERKATPTTHTEIMNRINEITFNSSLLAEFRAIDFVTRLIDQGRLPFYDKDTLPLKKPGLGAGVRIVPGGSAVRDGAYIGPDDWKHKSAVLDQWCEKEGRDPKTIMRTVNLGFYLGADAKGTARADLIFRNHWGGSPDRADRTGYLRGTVKDARAMVEQFRDLGCTRLSIAFREGPYDWDALEAFADEIVRPGA